jgi:hypothetical protein
MIRDLPKQCDEGAGPRWIARGRWRGTAADDAHSKPLFDWGSRL